MKNRLKESRENAKLTQRQVAENLNVDVKTLYKYENSIVPIPSDKLVELSRLYDRSIDYLIGICDYTTLTLVNDKGMPLAVVINEKVIEHKGYRVVFSVD